jgi:SAM-dependent methyltransferase
MGRILAWIARGASGLRACQNADLEQMSIEGLVLELGSTARKTPIQINGRVVRSNMTTDAKPDVCFNVEDGFPFRSQSFEVVLMLNVLEHLASGGSCIADIARVLKPGGELIIAVPFLFRIHGAPDDYSRFTSSALRRMCLNGGFHHVDVHEHGTGRCFAAFSHIDILRAPAWLRTVPAAAAMTLDTIWERLSARRPRQHMRGAASHPLGYMVRARR